MRNIKMQTNIIWRAGNMLQVALLRYISSVSEVIDLVDVIVQGLSEDKTARSNPPLATKNDKRGPSNLRMPT